MTKIASTRPKTSALQAGVGVKASKEEAERKKEETVEAKSKVEEAKSPRPTEAQRATARRAAANDPKVQQTRAQLDAKLDEDKEGFVRNGTDVVFRGTKGDDRYRVSQTSEGDLKVTNETSGRSWSVKGRDTALVNIETGDGDDRVTVDPSVTAWSSLTIDGGAGNDDLNVMTRYSRHRVRGGDGDDRITTASSWDGVDGGNGRDALVTNDRTYTLPEEQASRPRADESERSAEVVAQQKDALAESIRTGGTTQFVTSEGERVDVAVRETDGGYTYDLAGRTVTVDFDASYSEADRAEALAKVVDYHAQLPTYARDTFDSVTVEPFDREADYSAYFWRRGITFNGANAVTEDRFNHEVAHGVAYKASGETSAVPPGWDQAVADDKNEITSYGKGSFQERNDGLPGWILAPVFGSETASLRQEDFADAYSTYAEARESGPDALRDFEARYPNRARFLARYFDREVDSPLPRRDDAEVYA